MLKNQKPQESREKFLCFCSKVTHQSFYDKLHSNDFSNLENICEELGLANKCASCLPNIEDEFFQFNGKKHKIKGQFFNKNKQPIIQKIKNFTNSIFGNVFFNLNGHLPMLASNTIKTWLILSNHNPSNLTNLTVPFKLKIKIFDKNGKKIKSLVKLIYQNMDCRICLNDYISTHEKNPQPYYVKVTRTAIKKGFRGSTRTHFYYEAKNSMSTLHTQDGQTRKTSINLTVSNNKDKNFVFMINPLTKHAKATAMIKPLIKNQARTKVKSKTISIPPKGAYLAELQDLIDYKYKNHFFECNSSIPIKCYFIISDKNLEALSIDHI
ncbi:hypothetical protein N9T15_00820 [Pelagibacteraceae bacterium]|nr:hypothetical protein [Pelagibacteraceae bacterium]